MQNIDEIDITWSKLQWIYMYKVIGFEEIVLSSTLCSISYA